jgi:hypothetical protein
MNLQAVGLVAHLPPYLLELFRPTPIVPAPEPPRARVPAPFSSLADFLPCVPLKVASMPPLPPPRPAKGRSPAETEAAAQQWIQTRQTSEAVAKLIGPPECTLFLARFPYTITEARLYRSLLPLQGFRRLRIVEDTAGLPRGFAFALFSSPSDARSAAAKMQGLRVDGSRIIAEPVRAGVDPRFVPLRYRPPLPPLADPEVRHVTMGRPSLLPAVELRRRRQREERVRQLVRQAKEGAQDGQRSGRGRRGGRRGGRPFRGRGSFGRRR